MCVVGELVSVPCAFIRTLQKQMLEHQDAKLNNL